MRNEARHEEAANLVFESIDSVLTATASVELRGATLAASRESRTNHLETALIFGASILLHLVMAAHLRTAEPARARAPKVPSKVQIEIARQAPKVLPPEVPKPAEA